jgi:hypothetical protein
VFTAIAAVVVMVLAPASGHAADPLQPGDYVGTSIGGCTLSFVYDGLGAQAGKVYLGTAAHCVERVGDLVEDEAGAQFGRVALIGDADITALDYAFIEVLPDHVARVSAGVKGWPQFPTGYTTASETATGDVIQMSGYGLGYDRRAQTREQRIGVVMSDTAAEYVVTGLDTWGDSGGPFVHKKSGKAYGIVSRLCIGACTSEGPTVEGILAKAAGRGFTVRLRTV